MRLGKFFRSRWVKIPLLLIVLLIVLTASYLSYKLATTAPAMYNPLGLSQPVIAATASDNYDTLVYTSIRPSNWDIYLFDSLDAPPRRLTDDLNLDYNPVLSRDGRWVVFVSDRGGNPDLYAIDLNGKPDPVRLTSYAGMDDAPSLSPDGTRVAFVSTRSGNPDIFVMPFAPGDVSAETRAVNLTNNSYGDFNPAFSPDGTRIAFSSNRAIFGRWNPLRLIPNASAATDIYLMNSDGSNPQRVISALAVSGSPSWTKDGQALLYYQATNQTETAVYRTQLSDNKTVRLSPNTLQAITPSAGPADSAIFVAVDDGLKPNGQIPTRRYGGSLYRVAADGTNLTKFGDPAASYMAPYYDERSGKLVCHGDGPMDEQRKMTNGDSFTWPNAIRTLQLPDRTLKLHAMRSYFPTFMNDGDRVFAVQWVHEEVGYPPGPSAIVSANLDGTNVQPILQPTDSGFMWDPTITRDGKWIFFAKGARFGAVDENVDIWKVRPDGTGAVDLTANCDANDAFPDVSADGQWVVFRSGRDGKKGSGRNGNKEIYLMDKDGGQLRRISNSEGNDTMPAISPDGKWVVYVTDRTGKGLKLWIQSLVDPNDNGHLLEPQRADLIGLDMHPRFSPDGKWIVFTSDRAGYMDEWFTTSIFAPQPYGELYALPVDGSSLAIRLTDDKWEDSLAFWGRPHSNLSARPD
jgi:Tol biopolymer transport system component